MSDIAISVENLSKAYRIGLKEEIPDSLMVAAVGWAKAPLRNLRRLRRLNTFNLPSESAAQVEEDDVIWALKDVSFEVRHGEVVGIIGRNGAGKSTLLKVLSRITEPTSGRAIIRGRVSSLLEVGTGFHSELSGRENVYMNGTILGMTKREIDRKFDEIVDFSGVEKFLDTPVKRYSSGMLVRLAFAVAAHLEPEILIVDEVLAVGDMEFQNKCLGKMQNVAESGRTVLFVSHNMIAMNALCGRAILMAAGQMCDDGDAGKVIDLYLSDAGNATEEVLSARTDRIGSGRFRFTNICFSTDEPSMASGHWVSGRTGTVTLDYTSPEQTEIENVNLAVTFRKIDGSPLFVCESQCVDAKFAALPPAGQITCDIPNMPLAPGYYQVSIWATVSGGVADRVLNAGVFTVNEGDFFGTGRTTNPAKHGPFRVNHNWRVVVSRDSNT
jgi:lipopolysaccharide transport system ATP-binding protein